MAFHVGWDLDEALKELHRQPKINRVLTWLESEKGRNSIRHLPKITIPTAIGQRFYLPRSTGAILSSRPRTADGYSFTFVHSTITKGSRHDLSPAGFQAYVEGLIRLPHEVLPVAGAQRYVENGRVEWSDGSEASFGTIGITRAQRQEFWRAVEETERLGGIIQYRVIVSLPNEATPRQRLRIAYRFTDLIAAKGLPYWGVIHQPDKENDSRNYHLHLLYWNRPTARLPDGRWDFAVAEEYRSVSRNRRRRYPHRQPKDRSVGAGTSFVRTRGNLVKVDGWLHELRRHYAAVANSVLEQAGIDKRLTPAAYRDVGLDKTPTRPLGKRQAFLERVGVRTWTGAFNYAAELDYLAKTADPDLYGGIDAIHAQEDDLRRLKDDLAKVGLPFFGRDLDQAYSAYCAQLTAYLDTLARAHAVDSWQRRASLRIARRIVDIGPSAPDTLPAPVQAKLQAYQTAFAALGPDTNPDAMREDATARLPDAEAALRAARASLDHAIKTAERELEQRETEKTRPQEKVVAAAREAPARRSTLLSRQLAHALAALEQSEEVHAGLTETGASIVNGEVRRTRRLAPAAQLDILHYLASLQSQQAKLQALQDDAKASVELANRQLQQAQHQGNHSAIYPPNAGDLAAAGARAQRSADEAFAIISALQDAVAQRRALEKSLLQQASEQERRDRDATEWWDAECRILHETLRAAKLAAERQAQIDRRAAAWADAEQEQLLENDWAKIQAFQPYISAVAANATERAETGSAIVEAERVRLRSQVLAGDDSALEYLVHLTRDVQILSQFSTEANTRLADFETLIARYEVGGIERTKRPMAAMLLPALNNWLNAGASDSKQLLERMDAKIAARNVADEKSAKQADVAREQARKAAVLQAEQLALIAELDELNQKTGEATADWRRAAKLELLFLGERAWANSDQAYVLGYDWTVREVIRRADAIVRELSQLANQTREWFAEAVARRASLTDDENINDALQAELSKARDLAKSAKNCLYQLEFYTTSLYADRRAHDSGIASMKSNELAPAPSKSNDRAPGVEGLDQPTPIVVTSEPASPTVMTPIHSEPLVTGLKGKPEAGEQRAQLTEVDQPPPESDEDEHQREVAEGFDHQAERIDSIRGDQINVLIELGSLCRKAKDAAKSLSENGSAEIERVRRGVAPPPDAHRDLPYIMRIRRRILAAERYADAVFEKVIAAAGNLQRRSVEATSVDIEQQGLEALRILAKELSSEVATRIERERKILDRLIARRHAIETTGVATPHISNLDGKSGTTPDTHSQSPENLAPVQLQPPTDVAQPQRDSAAPPASTIELPASPQSPAASHLSQAALDNTKAGERSPTSNSSPPPAPGSQQRRSADQSPPKQAIDEASAENQRTQADHVARELSAAQNAAPAAPEPKQSTPALQPRENLGGRQSVQTADEGKQTTVTDVSGRTGVSSGRAAPPLQTGAVEPSKLATPPEPPAAIPPSVPGAVPYFGRPRNRKDLTAWIDTHFFDDATEYDAKIVATAELQTKLTVWKTSSASPQIIDEADRRIDAC